MKWIAFNPDWDAPSLDSLGQKTSVAVAPAPTPAPVREEIKVVVAEDDPISREVICSQLRAWGFAVLVTCDGGEAMEALRAQTQPILAVLDWMMPGMDGLEVCRRVRASERLVYILLLTARSGKEQMIEGLQAGADDYLVKPFHKEELHARLKVGVRILLLHATLAARVAELEEALEENRSLRLQIPL